jgi:hypothetical protein
MDNLMNLLPFFIVIAIALVVVFTELVKRLDKKDRLKGYRVYVPLVLSLGAAFLLKIGNFFVSAQMWFWWAVIFGFSVFAYEAILNKVKKALGNG